jgi:hypothetical protein
MKRLLASAMLMSLCCLGLVAAGEKGKAVELDGLNSVAPAKWKVEPGSNKLRLYQITVPKAAGDTEDAEIAVFYFGAGSGGSVADNVKRWKGMFDAPKGKEIDDVAKITKMKAGDVDLTYLDVEGTYLFKNPPFAPNAKTERKENFRMFAVVFESKNGPFFLRMTGPAKTMAANKDAFDGWLKNFK